MRMGGNHIVDVSAPSIARIGENKVLHPTFTGI